MLSVLSDSQKAIVEAMVMGLHVKQALLYLQDHGYPMSERKYFRQKKKIDNMRYERMHYIALQFQDQHIERVDKCELIEKLMWDNYHAEKDPTKRVGILSNILNMQTYLSAYYDATKWVMEQQVKTQTDLMKLPTTYLTFNVRKIREKEMEREREAKRFAINREREEQSRLENQIPIPLPSIPVSVVEEQPIIEVKEDKEESNPEPEPEPKEEETLSEGDLYWQTHPRMKPKN